MSRGDLWRRYTAYGKKKHDSQFQLVDNFTLFHLKFMDGESNPDEQTMVTSKGVAHNAHSGIVQSEVTLEDLFNVP